MESSKTQIPDYVRLAIGVETAKISPAKLREAALALSERYRGERETGGKLIDSPADRMAYLIARVPATYAVLRTVFAEANRNYAEEKPRTLLDLGAGPGTALWAAAEEFASLERAVLVERDAGWIDLGKRIAHPAPHGCVASAAWQRADLPEQTGFPPYDMVVMSYFLGEIEQERLEQIVLSAWKSTNGMMICLEPGSRRGFASIRHVRDILLRQGAHVIAPCTHEETCPMSADDWCHFPRRVLRGEEHRRSKAAVLPYEDEKFSYAVFCRSAVKRAAGRLVRRPIKGSGHVLLDVCLSGEIRRITVSRKQKEIYRHARDLRWGDAWEEGGNSPVTGSGCAE